MQPDRFSFETIKDFDQHIAASIPNYAEIHRCIDGMMTYFVKPEAKILDIGCSTGKLLKRIDEKYKHLNMRLAGVDRSENLLPESTERCQFTKANLETVSLDPNLFDVVFSIFTLCFIPIRDRQNIVSRIWESLRPGGAFIVTEKLYSSDPKIQDIFTFLYYDHKKQYFGADHILQKEQDLRQIQHPMTEEENKDMFKRASFRKMDCFWRYYNFAGWICIK